MTRSPDGDLQRTRNEAVDLTKLLHRIGWIGLTVVAAFLLFAVAADLAADHRDGPPADHTGAFTALAGQSFITTLEVGYALHELTFAAIPRPRAHPPAAPTTLGLVDLLGR